MKPNTFLVYWIFWLAAFIVPELWAVFAYKPDTLSDEVWGIEQLSLSHPYVFSQWTPAHWIAAIIVWGLFGWLSVHLPFGLLK